MKCPNCKKKTPRNCGMCIACGYPIKAIPMPPGGKLQFGPYDWYVLDKRDDRALIITEKVIEFRPYHHEECEITWETCDMRKYLNGEFYDSFSEAGWARIIEVTNETPDNPWYGTPGSNPTVDKIFLLSTEEVVKYFGDSGQLKTKNINRGCDWCNDEFFPWLGDKYDINRRAVDDTGIVRFWRLRSPGANTRSVASVSGFVGDGFDQGCIGLGNADILIDGHFVQDGPGYLSSDKLGEQSCNGVRPALWLKQVFDPYVKCPEFESEHFRLRQVRAEDAEDLMSCCGVTLAEMKKRISMWLDEYYRKKWYIRFTVIDKGAGRIVGSIEIAKLDALRATLDYFDLSDLYKTQTYLLELLALAEREFLPMFGVKYLRVGAFPFLAEVLRSAGYVPLLPEEDHWILPSENQAYQSADVPPCC